MTARNPQEESNALNSFLNLIPDWYPSLAGRIRRALERGLKDAKDIDSLLMEVTKDVEEALRSLVEQRTMAKFPSVTGDGLVDEAVRFNILQSNSLVWHELKKYFKEPRNPSHHRFLSYSLSEAARVLLETDRLLREIDRQRNERRIDAYYSLSAVPSEKAIQFKVTTPGVPETAEGFLKAQAGRMEKEIPMRRISTDTWESRLFPASLPGQYISASFYAVDNSGILAASSGTVLTVSSFLASATLTGSGASPKGIKPP